MKELHQIHERGVLNPKLHSDLSLPQHNKVSSYLMCLKQKHNGTFNGWGYVDGQKQWTHITKEETSSPTVAIESVILSCAIDAK
jgi:hypothetical protein